MAIIDNMVACWELEEAEAATRVDAHGANDLTQFDAVNQAAGKVGNAADFPGPVTAGSLRIVSNSDLQLGDIDFTFAFFINMQAAAAAVDASIFGKGGATDGEYQVGVDKDDQKVTMKVWSTSGYGGEGSVIGPALSLLTWAFVIAWYDATANKLFIQVDNGTPVEAAHSGGAFVGTDGFRVSNGAMFTLEIQALIDQLMFWKRVLTADERTWLYNAGNGRSYADIVAGMSGVVVTNVVPSTFANAQAGIVISGSSF